MYSKPDKALSVGARSVVPQDPGMFIHLPYVIEVNDEIVRTRQNGLMISLEISGIDGLTASPQDIEALRRSFASVIDGLDDRFTFYIHRLHRKSSLGLKPIYGDSFAADVERSWRTHLNGKDLHEFVVIVTIVRSLAAPLKIPLFGKAANRIFDKDSAARLHELQELASVLEGGLPNVSMRRLRISDGSLIGFYSSLHTGLLKTEYRGAMTLISEDVTGTAATFFPDYVLFDEGIERKRVAAVLAIKRYSQETWPGMLDALDSSIETVISHSFTPIASHKISDKVRLRVKQMQAADDLAVSISDQLIQTADDVETGRQSVGVHQMQITVFADSLSELDEQVSKIKGAAEQAKVKLVRCESSLEATFFAAHPGNMDYRAWTMMVASTTFADMASLHMSDSGSPASDLHWRTPVTVYQTATGAAHRFSFQVPGKPEAEPPLGHTLVLGPSYSGKTTTTAFLAAQAQRIPGLRTIIFDKDQGLRSVIAALDGDYAQIKVGQATGLNPFYTETASRMDANARARGEAWLLDWLKALIERKRPLSTLQELELKEAVRKVSAAPDELKNFDDFVSLIGAANDDRDLAMRVAEWTSEGQYRWVFGEADRQVVDFERNKVIGIDMTEVLDHPAERTAILSYIFRRMEWMFEDRVPTLVIIDEAHAVFDDEYFAARMPKWTVTVRKLGVVMVFMTQFPSQIENSLAKNILEGLPHRLIFPNSRARETDYDNYGLSESELAFVLDGQRGPRRALYNGPTGSTLLDVDLSPLGPLLTALGGGKAAADAFGPDFLERPFFWRNDT